MATLNTYPDSISVEEAIQTRMVADLSAINNEVAAVTAGSGALVSSNDTTVGYLNGKLLGGDGIKLTEGSDGGNETLTISTGPGQNLIANSAFGLWSNASLETERTIPDSTTTVAGTTCTSTAHLLTAGKLVKDGAGVCFKVISITNANVFEVDRTGANSGSQWYEVVPGCVAADTKAADGHTKTSTLDTWQLHNNSTYSSDFYGLYTKKGANTAEYYNLLNLTTAEGYTEYRGKTVSFGIMAYSTTATDNVKIQIYDGVGTTSSSFAGANAKEWLEISHTVNAAATQLTMRILLDGDTNDVAYFSLPMGIKGSSIGEGNYQQPPGEIVWLEASISGQIHHNQTITTSTDGAVYIEADSNGKLPKGAKAVQLYVRGNCAVENGSLLVYAVSNGYGAVLSASADASVYEMATGWCPVHADGYVVVAVDQDWTNCHWRYGAVQVS